MTRQKDCSPSSSAGRPRSIKSKQAILTAAWTLCVKGSVRKVSIEAIARNAGVGKATIYRWWPSKTAVIVDAFLERDRATLPFPIAESATDSFKEQMLQLEKVFNSDIGRIVAEIIAEGQTDSTALESFRSRFLTPRREAAKHVIADGIASGEFDASLDPEIAIDILYGPIYYRLLVQHLPVTKDFVSKLSHRAIICLQKPL